MTLDRHRAAVGRVARACSLGGAAAVALAAHARPAGAQLTATLDAGAASVAYDEFLRSTALTITPSLRVERDGGAVLARGAYSRFEGGNESMQGLVAASLLSRPVWGLRGELLGAAGASRYDGRRSSASLLGVARAHRVGRASGWWLGGGVGTVNTGVTFSRRDIVQGDAGVWRRAGPVVFSATMTPTWLGHGSPIGREFADGVGTLQWTHRRGELSASVGHRLGDRGDGVRNWGELGVVAWVTRRLAVVAGGGSYPTDLTQGLPGGHYAAVAVRIASRAPRVIETLRRGDVRRPYEVGRRGGPESLAFSVMDAGGGVRAIRVVAAGARRVELMGDFTGWEPVELASDAGDGWVVRLAIAPGVHRVNVRVDGGPWVAPPGLSSVADDFGGRVGVFVVR